MAATESTGKFGTFTGVFTPTLLTILGVILYVRLPWVVGNAGLIGAFGVMGLAMGITVCTGLSLSSIATNTRLGAGGPYAMIRRALGLEVGGSVGVPLYLSRPLGVAMYIFGFREGWLWVFPTHEPFLVDLAVFVALFGLAYASADLAFRVQYLIMAVIIVSIVSIFISPRALAPEGDFTLFGDWRGFPEREFGGTDFWAVFAVFFPATTGILAGANMSGDLRDSRRSIAKGTLWAIAVSTVIYFALATWASYTGTREELTSNYNFFIDASSFGPGVLAGLLGATFSSALASAVGGPRILMAMGQNGILPKSEVWAKTSDKGEPRNAVVLTAVLTFACLLVRDLNAIAPLVTMFFLITYLTINVVLLIETSLALPSFRPSLTVPLVVPFLGAIGCVFTMFIVNPTFGLIAVGTSIAIYVYISRRETGRGPDDVRSSIFAALAEWGAAKVVQLGGSNVRAWKPNLLVPVRDASVARGGFQLLVDLCRPEGSVKFLALPAEGEKQRLVAELDELTQHLRDKQLFGTWSLVTSSSFGRGVMHGLQALQSSFFRPNILFLTLPRDPTLHTERGRMMVEANETGVGVMLYGRHLDAGLGERRTVHLWLRRAPNGWGATEAFEENNLDLTLLMGLRLFHSWGATLRVITVVGDEADQESAKRFLDEVCDIARMPTACERVVLVGDFDAACRQAPQSDLDILGMQATPDFAWMNRMIDNTRSDCLFVSDSGRESARA